jgi:hypothetical protein
MKRFPIVGIFTHPGTIRSIDTELWSGCGSFFCTEKKDGRIGGKGQEETRE